MDALVRARARGRSSATRRLACFIVGVAALTLLLCSSAAAYKPGQLVFAKTTGSASTSVEAWAAAPGAKGVSAAAGYIDASATPQPWVAVYKATGKLKWAKAPIVAQAGYAEDVCIDKQGNVYVAGESDQGSGGGYDIFLTKYSAAGAPAWTITYAGPANLNDYTEDLALDGSGNAVIVGTSNMAGGLAGIVVLKTKPNGDAAWPAQRYDPDPADPLAGQIQADELALDGGGNVYVAGQTIYDSHSYALTLRFAGANGSRTWGQVYNATGADGARLEDLAVRGGRVVVVGWARPSAPDADALAISYDAATGAQKAAKRWTGGVDGSWFGDVAIDAKGSVYVTGDLWMSGKWDKALTMKWNAGLAKATWTQAYLPRSKDAENFYLALDPKNNVFVTGYAVVKGGKDAILTMKYSPAGKRLWLKTWLPSGATNAEPDDIQLGTDGTVLVPGVAWFNGYSKGALLKYGR